jgi:hypothetical protein
MTDLFGREVVPASRSRPPAKEVVAPTNGTYGRIGSVSSASAALQRSLANRLRPLLDGAGSTLFSLTWRRKVTPRGRPYCQLAASARPTSDSGCGSWGTPTVQDGKHATLSPSEQARDPNILRNQVHSLASWPTPVANQYEADPEATEARRLACAAKQNNGNGFGLTTAQCAQLASWQTPKAHDGEWSTPRTSGRPFEKSTHLQTQAQLAHQLSGPISTGSPAPTEKRGQLNPAHSRWLQGYPKEWCEAAIMAHRSMRTRARKDV